MSDSLRNRAAGVLGVPVDAAPAAAVAAFLTALPTTDFLPPSDLAAAVNILAGTAVPTERDGDPALSLRERVEDFARRYWSLAPAARTAEWLALGQNQPDELASARLLWLETGLDVVTEALLDPLAEELAVLARELFILPPRERAIRRNTWLLENVTRYSELCAAMEALLHQDSPFTRLDPVLPGRLNARFDAVAFAKGAQPLNGRRATGASASGMPHVHTGDTSRPPSFERGYGWGFRLGCFLAGSLFLLSALAGAWTKPARPIPKAPTAPQKARPGDDSLPAAPARGPRSGTWFSEAEVASFRAFEAGQVAQPSSRYSDWVRAGRPEPTR